MRRVHHRERVSLSPNVAHDQREQAKHPARALKGFDGRELRVEELQKRRVKRVVRPNAALIVGSDRLIGQSAELRAYISP